MAFNMVMQGGDECAWAGKSKCSMLGDADDDDGWWRAVFLTVLVTVVPKRVCAERATREGMSKVQRRTHGEMVVLKRKSST